MTKHSQVCTGSSSSSSFKAESSISASKRAGWQDSKCMSAAARRTVGQPGRTWDSMRFMWGRGLLGRLRGESRRESMALCCCSAALGPVLMGGRSCGAAQFSSEEPPWSADMPARLIGLHTSCRSAVEAAMLTSASLLRGEVPSWDMAAWSDRRSGSSGAGVLAPVSRRTSALIADAMAAASSADSSISSTISVATLAAVSASRSKSKATVLVLPAGAQRADQLGASCLEDRCRLHCSTEQSSLSGADRRSSS